MGLGRRKGDLLLLNHSGVRQYENHGFWYSYNCVPVTPTCLGSRLRFAAAVTPVQGSQTVSSTICWPKWNISMAYFCGCGSITNILKLGVIILYLQCHVIPSVFICLSIYFIYFSAQWVQLINQNSLHTSYQVMIIFFLKIIKKSSFKEFFYLR